MASRKRQAAADDPERTTNTVAKGSALPDEEDPERVNPTMAKAPNPLPDDDDDPERDNKTNARKPAPKRRPPTRPPRPAEELDEGSGYSTGQNYQAVDEDEEPNPASLSLDGDGLDALDPEVVPKTKALPQLEDDTAAEDPEGADDANATRAGPPIKLEIVSGPDAGKKRRFKGVRMVIGRMPGIDFQLSDQSVSRRHVELVHSDAGTLLRDLGSGNGTKLNGSKISADTILKHGDEIQIGKTKLRYVDELAAFKQAREDAEKREAEEAKALEPAEASEEEAASEGENEDAASESSEEGEGEGEASAEEEPAEEEAKESTKSRARRPVRTTRQAPEAGGGLGARLKAMNPKVRLALIGGVVVLFLLIAVGIATRKPKPPPVDVNAETAALKMQEARAAAKDGRYEDAVSLVDDAEKLVPGIDKTKLGVQAREALAVQRGFEQVRKNIQEKRFEDAKKQLAEIPKANAKNESDRVKLEEELGVALVAYHKDKVKEFLAAGELDSAKQELAQVPADQLDDLPQQIDEFERTVLESQAQDAKDAKRAAAAAAAAKKAKREEEIALAFVIVERKFAGGEWERAASECARVLDAYSGDREIGNRAKSLAAGIPNFGRNFDEGMRKYRQNQLVQAAKPLRLALQTYRTLGLVQNRYGEELAQVLLKAALAAGKESLIRDDLENAIANFREARRIEPDNPDARKGYEGVADKAENLYLLAYSLRETEPREALRKLKIVIAVTEAGSPVHEKAKNQVAALAP